MPLENNNPVRGSNHGWIGGGVTRRIKAIEAEKSNNIEPMTASAAAEHR